MASNKKPPFSKIKSLAELTRKSTGQIFDNIENMQKFQEEFQEEIKNSRENQLNDIIIEKNKKIAELEKKIDKREYIIFLLSRNILRAIIVFIIYYIYWT